MSAPAPFLRRSKLALAAGDFACALSAARAAGAAASSAAHRAHAAVMEAQALHELGDADGARTVAFDALNSARDPPTELVLVAASVALDKGARRSAQAVLERALQGREGSDAQRAHLAGLLVLRAHPPRQADEARAALERVKESIPAAAAERIAHALRRAERAARPRARGGCRALTRVLRDVWEAAPVARARLEETAREVVDWVRRNPLQTRRLLAAALLAAFVLARLAGAVGRLRRSGTPIRFVRSLLRSAPP